jgi:hypothetical protein
VDKQTAFIEHYEQLKGSLKENEPLLFMDAVHPTQAAKITSGWIRKGVDKSIKTTGSRTCHQARAFRGRGDCTI